MRTSIIAAGAIFAAAPGINLIKRYADRKDASWPADKAAIGKLAICQD